MSFDVIDWSVLDWVFVVVSHLLGGLAAIHALLTKRDPRAAIGWIAVCLLVPIAGVIIYLLFGINHISMTAKKWETRGLLQARPGDLNFDASSYTSFEEAMYEQHAFQGLAKSGEKITGWPLLSGCKIESLFDGSEAYPQMLKAINEAKSSVYLSTYLFGTKGMGGQFIDALTAAHQRGVTVRVLVDGVGGLYSWPTAVRMLKKRGVPAAAFLSPLSYHTVHLNLRNHRKIMVVDGAIGFTGGMNIHDENYAKPGKTPNIRDLHFRVEGPIVGYLQDVFLHDWNFATKQSVGSVVYYDNTPKGTALARAIAPGPNAKHAQFALMVCSALSCAQRHVRIMSPYFLLGYSQTSAAISAALRGVEIEVILPESNNLSFVKGASEANLPYLLEHGVKVYYRKGEFAHTKLLVVDDFCVLLGSSNLDTRSLMLNFEFNLEVYDHKLASNLIEHFEEVKLQSRIISLDWLKSRSFWIRLNNAFFKLFSLYL